MSIFIQVLRLVAILIAAILLGKWYLSEYKKARYLGKPWYTAYISIPGILIILVLLLPVIIRFFNP
jgi:uncharacterized protein HemY